MQRSPLIPFILMFGMNACGEKSAPETSSPTSLRLSGTGESCLKTSDCEAPGRCVDNKCIREGEIASPPKAESGAPPKPVVPAPELVGAPPTLQLSTPDSLARVVIKALADNDYSTFSRLIPTREDLAAMVAEAVGLDSLAEDVLPTELDEKLKKAVRKGKEGWERVRAKGEAVGVIWPETTYSRVEFKSTSERSIEMADIYLFFKFRGLEYSIELDDCLKTKRGWLMLDNMNWQDRSHAVTGGADNALHDLPPTCTKFIERYEKCIEEMPKAARGPARDGLMQMQDAWSRAPREGMEKACAVAFDATAGAMGAACPRVNWE